MNINCFDYQTNPHIQTKKWAIHALSDDGFNRYRDENQSYVHRYLKSLYPMRMKEIFNCDCSPLKNNIKTEEMKAKTQEEGEFPVIDEKCNTEAHLQINGTHEAVSGSTNISKKNDSTSKLSNSISDKNVWKFIKTKSKMRNPKILNLKNYDRCNFKNIISPVSNRKYFENYPEKFEMLKTSLNSMLTPQTTRYSNFSFNAPQKGNKPLLGFTSTNVPRIDGLCQPSNVVSPKKIHYVTTTMSLSDIEEENEKLRTYLQNMEKSKVLPKINKLSKQPNPKKVDQPIHNNKIMGEKYNPDNFKLDILRSTIRRNNNGALFCH